MHRPPLHTAALLLACASLVVLLAIQPQARAADVLPLGPLPQWGPDIQVNPSPPPEAYHPLQLNLALAANPANPNILLAGWESYQLDPTPDAYAWSTDQGLTWSGGRFNDPWDPWAMSPARISDLPTASPGASYRRSLPSPPATRTPYPHPNRPSTTCRRVAHSGSPSNAFTCTAL
jgi:hypothetical protein